MTLSKVARHKVWVSLFPIDEILAQTFSLFDRCSIPLTFIFLNDFSSLDVATNVYTAPCFTRGKYRMLRILRGKIFKLEDRGREV